MFPATMEMKLNFKWLFRDIRQQIWFSVALYCLLGFIAAISALFLDPFIPEGVSSKIGADAVDRILGIIAASMLAVTTFSISTMVQAFVSASTGATPRAAQLVVEDRTAQQALASFIGAFVFSLVGLIALSTGSYGSSGRLVLFAATIGVIVLIVLMLMRWIQRLSRLGRLGETIDQVEQATLKAVQARRDAPCLGGHCASGKIPAGTFPIAASSIGYVRRIDVEGLSKLAEENDCEIYVSCLPGAFATPDRPLLAVTIAVDETLQAKLRGCFMVGDQRSFEQDPRFGFIVLAEIASRALSPAVNDPGTAIDVIGTMVRLMADWVEKQENTSKEIRHPYVHVPPIAFDDVLDDAVVPIARDGAAIVEVGIRLQKGLLAMQQFGHPELASAARKHAISALARAVDALVFAEDRDRLRAIARNPA